MCVGAKHYTHTHFSWQMCYAQVLFWCEPNISLNEKKNHSSFYLSIFLGYQGARFLFSILFRNFFSSFYLCICTIILLQLLCLGSRHSLLSLFLWFVVAMHCRVVYSKNSAVICCCGGFLALGKHQKCNSHENSQHYFHKWFAQSSLK